LPRVRIENVACLAVIVAGLRRGQPARNNKPPIGVIRTEPANIGQGEEIRRTRKTRIPAAQIQTTVEFRSAA
jgi:hypothetical protein